MNAVLAAPVIPADCSQGPRGLRSNAAARRGDSISAPLKPSQAASGAPAPKHCYFSGFFLMYI